MRPAPMVVLALASWAPAVMVASGADSQPGVSRQREQLQVRVVGDASLEGTWQILQATLDENHEATWATVIVRNATNRDVPRSRLYAEYFDAKGRLCLTAVFTQEEEDGAFGVGEVRELRIPVGQLAPAAAPAEVRVRTLGPTPGPADAVVKLPITITSWNPPGLEKLPGALALAGVADPVVSLALIEVSVGADGKALRARVVGARSPDAADWFRRFAESLSYNTMRPGSFDPQSGVCLVLVRLQQERAASPYAARDDSWVRRYLGETDSREIPPVNELRFIPETWLAGAPADESAPVYQYVSVGTEWCPESFHRVYPSAGVMRLEWYQGPNRPHIIAGPASH